MTAWWERMACKGTGVEFVFDTNDASQKRINRCKTICARCPVADPCLTNELDVMRQNLPSIGVFGGSTQAERRLILQVEQQQMPLDDPRTDPMDHGTGAGYTAHLRNGTDPCDDCLAAHARDVADYRAANRDELNERRRLRTWSKNWLARRRAAAYTDSMRLRTQASAQHQEAS